MFGIQKKPKLKHKRYFPSQSPIQLEVFDVLYEQLDYMLKNMRGGARRQAIKRGVFYGAMRAREELLDIIRKGGGHGVKLPPRKMLNAKMRARAEATVSELKQEGKYGIAESIEHRWLKVKPGYNKRH